MDLLQEMNNLKEVIDKELKNVIKECSYQKKIVEAMEYSLFTGGKRLRPILLLESCELFKGEYEDAMPFALAIEMIHTYSLIHDDLPSMDNDDYRRGKLTNHKVFGDALAILAGDGLLNLAYETMAENIINKSHTLEDYRRYVRAMNVIANASGIYGMVGGQVVDILSEGKNIERDELFFMYKNKTAALIQASLISGGIIGGAGEEELKKLEEYGLAIGVSYQIKDDVLDYNSGEDDSKTTYLSFHTVDEAKKEIEELDNNAINIVKYFVNKDRNRAKFFEKFAYYLTGRNK
ncbi:polyprenyl synthetase family protein [Sporanaerobacter sp. PP17-6a]|jgi:geranylgeranyl diphosphate synthase type II|uniref:polyprenyl synthetase family protein n=1 Tax=Sporanaerobacter sp. PP17-6a TaxID=1891289 RepID=UPI00089F968D|nr:farnesyl diphosphate synthase [Sporanaerobacter sp. PP17-6a]SCL82361.1 Farnesyl diphosphate synthase [Sporanaerobacter sp. PP17-6a]